MKFQYFIALRYLFAKKSNNIINWISGISVAVIAIVTAALIIILSAMNGLSDTVMNMYSNFDPDIKITPRNGKFFDPSSIDTAKIKSLDEVVFFVESVEETVLLKYRDNQEVAVVKGVSDQFAKMTFLDEYIIEGYFSLLGGGRQTSVIGADLALKLGVNTALPHPVGIFIPNFEDEVAFTGDFFKSIYPRPVGVFDINPDFNNKYILVTVDFARELLNIKNEVSSIELGLKNDVDVDLIKEKIETLVGDDYEVKTRFEQNEFLFKSINTEKWITLMILSLIVVLAIFNVIGSLTMLVIDKKKDIFILQSMGASLKNVKFIFWLEGCLIALLGAVIGTVLGATACYLQIATCFFGYGAGGRVECFPMDIQTLDIVIAFIVVVGIAAFFTMFPVMRIKLQNANAE